MPTDKEITEAMNEYHNEMIREANEQAEKDSKIN